MEKTNLNTINIATLGQIGSGKTTLTAAITKVLEKTGRAKASSYDSINEAPEEIYGDTVINVSRVEYDTKYSNFRHIDCPNFEDYKKGTDVGAFKIDVVILVFPAVYYDRAETENYIQLCRQIDIRGLVVYLNKCDLLDENDKEFFSMVEEDIKDELGFFGYSPRIIRGSAIYALDNWNREFGIESISRLLETAELEALR